MKNQSNWKDEQKEIFTYMLNDKRLTPSAKKQIAIFLEILRDDDLGFDTTSALMYGFLRNDEFTDPIRCPLSKKQVKSAMDYFRQEASISRAKEALLLKKVSKFPLSECFGDKIDLEDLAISCLTYASREKHFTYSRNRVDFIYKYLQIPDDIYLNVFDLFHDLERIEIDYNDLMINISRIRFKMILPYGDKMPRLTMNYKAILPMIRGQEKFNVSRLSANDLENLYCELLSLSGFTPIRLGKLNQGDGGIDIIGVSNAEPAVGRFVVAVQCKTSINKIQPRYIREFIGAISDFRANKGVFVTTSSFTDAAVKCEEKSRLPIELMDYVALSNQIRKHVDKI